MNKQRRVGETVAIQSWLRPALTPVIANKDFAVFREQLERVGGLLEGSLLEEMAMDFGVIGFEAASAVSVPAHGIAKEFEFCNTLFLAERAQGLILGRELYRQNALPEWRQRQESMSEWSVRSPKQVPPMPARPGKASSFHHRLSPCISNHRPSFKILGLGTGSTLVRKRPHGSLKRIILADLPISHGCRRALPRAKRRAEAEEKDPPMGAKSMCHLSLLPARVWERTAALGS